MRILGLVLVALGGLTLAHHVFVQPARGTADADPVQPTQERAGAPSVPPVASGIVVVSGLLLVATARRRNGV